MTLKVVPLRYYLRSNNFVSQILVLCMGKRYMRITSFASSLNRTRSPSFISRVLLRHSLAFGQGFTLWHSWLANVSSICYLYFTCSIPLSKIFILVTAMSSLLLGGIFLCLEGETSVEGFDFRGLRLNLVFLSIDFNLHECKEVDSFLEEQMLPISLTTLNIY